MLAERHRARLAMQEGEVNARTETRRGQRVARRLFQDQDQDQDRNRDPDCNLDRNNELEQQYAAVDDNLTNRLSEEARRDLANAKQRWNFDFENERPLPGRWDWRKVGGVEKEGENLRVNGDEYEEENVEDWDEEKADQREKSETEANEKAELSASK